MKGKTNKVASVILAATVASTAVPTPVIYAEDAMIQETEMVTETEMQTEPVTEAVTEPVTEAETEPEEIVRSVIDEASFNVQDVYKRQVLICGASRI